MKRLLLLFVEAALLMTASCAVSTRSQGAAQVTPPPAVSARSQGAVQPAPPATQETVVTRRVLPMFVQGRVVFDDGRPFPPIFPNLYIHVKGQRGVNTVGEDGIRIRGSGSFGATPVGKDGTFTLVLQDGEHELALVTGLGDPLSRADGYYVTSMVSGAKDILREKLVVENRTALPITITLAPFKTPGK